MENETWRIDVSEGNGVWRQGTLYFQAFEDAQAFAFNTYVKAECRIVPTKNPWNALYSSGSLCIRSLK